VIWTAAIATAAVFFAALLAHEFAHALVARARGMPVLSITLFALGGMARMSREARDARSEFQFSIAGPLTILIGAAAPGLAPPLGCNYEVAPSSTAMAMLVWFGVINIAWRFST
jgi:Zn-dependent protease